MHAHRAQECVAFGRHLGAGSRQFQDFEDYLLPTAAFEALLHSDSLPLAIAGSFDRYWTERGTLLRDELQKVDGLAARHELPAADFVDGVLKVTPLTSGVPEEAEAVAPRQNYRPASGSGSLPWCRNRTRDRD